MSRRYESRKRGLNESELYEEFFDERGVKRITHYRTPKFPKLTSGVRSRFASLQHRWKLGDSYWKLASKHYGDPKLWWVLAWYNEKPTENHVDVGGIIFIPKPVEEVVSYFHFGA